MTKMLHSRIIAATFVVVLMSFSQASAQDVCDAAAQRADFDIRNAYGQKIDFLLRVAGSAQARGIDPTKFPQTVPGGGVEVINLPMTIQHLAIQRDTALQDLFRNYQGCKAGFAPYQRIFDGAGFYMTGGMSMVLPRAVTYIDASQIMTGYPLGGSSALVPKARDDILKGLGVGGDVAKVIRNPRCIFGC